MRQRQRQQLLLKEAVNANATEDHHDDDVSLIPGRWVDECGQLRIEQQVSRYETKCMGQGAMTDEGNSRILRFQLEKNSGGE
jgi:hypothetical protein